MWTLNDSPNGIEKLRKFNFFLVNLVKLQFYGYLKTQWIQGHIAGWVSSIPGPPSMANSIWNFFLYSSMFWVASPYFFLKLWTVITFPHYWQFARIPLVDRLTALPLISAGKLSNAFSFDSYKALLRGLIAAIIFLTTILHWYIFFSSYHGWIMRSTVIIGFTKLSLDNFFFFFPLVQYVACESYPFKFSFIIWLLFMLDILWSPHCYPRIILVIFHLLSSFSLSPH